MTRWEYFAASHERGMISWEEHDGNKHSQSLQGGLRFLGSQGWELVGTLDQTALGTTTSHQLIFKRVAAD